MEEPTVAYTNDMDEDEVLRPIPGRVNEVWNGRGNKTPSSCRQARKVRGWGSFTWKESKLILILN